MYKPIVEAKLEIHAEARERRESQRKSATLQKELEKHEKQVRKSQRQMEKLQREMDRLSERKSRANADGRDGATATAESEENQIYVGARVQIQNVIAKPELNGR